MTHAPEDSASDVVRPDRLFPETFHSPGVEPWIFGTLRGLGPWTGSFLDIGCGYGIWGHLLATYLFQGARVVGIDRNRSRLDAIIPGSYIAVITADVSRLPFRSRFDASLSVEVLQAVSNPRRALEEMERVTRRLIIVAGPSTPPLLHALRERGYHVYAYFFRGLALVNLQTRRTLFMHSSRLNPLLNIFVHVYRVIQGEPRYVLAVKLRDHPG